MRDRGDIVCISGCGFTRNAAAILGDRRQHHSCEDGCGFVGVAQSDVGDHCIRVGLRGGDRRWVGRHRCHPGSKCLACLATRCGIGEGGLKQRAGIDQLGEAVCHRLSVSNCGLVDRRHPVVHVDNGLGEIGDHLVCNKPGPVIQATRICFTTKGREIHLRYLVARCQGSVKCCGFNRISEVFDDVNNPIFRDRVGPERQPRRICRPTIEGYVKKLNLLCRG